MAPSLGIQIKQSQAQHVDLADAVLLGQVEHAALTLDSAKMCAIGSEPVAQD
jgi:hypothetical protein